MLGVAFLDCPCANKNATQKIARAVNFLIMES
jgi:hypothetical protein